MDQAQLSATNKAEAFKQALKRFSLLFAALLPIIFCLMYFGGNYSLRRQFAHEQAIREAVHEDIKMAQQQRNEDLKQNALKNWKVRAAATLGAVKQEAAHEAGPYFPAFIVHSDLMEGALQDFERRTQLIKDESDIEKLQLRRKIRGVQRLLNAMPDSDSQAETTMKQVTNGIEDIISQLVEVGAQGDPFGAPLDGNDASIVVERYQSDLYAFLDAADKFLSSPNFDTGLDACMRSRIASIAALLAAPEVLADTEGPESIQKFIDVLTDVVEQTTKLAASMKAADPNASNVNDAVKSGNAPQWYRLEKYSKSEERRVKLLQAIKDRDAKQLNAALASNG